MSERTVLGLGGNVDYEVVWDSATIERLVVEHDIWSVDLSNAVPIDSERNLVCSLLAFLRDGVGGERSVASNDLVERFAARFDKAATLGGTGVRCALAMATLGVRSTVHLVSIDDHVRRLLPAGISYLCSADGDTFDPHLIVQYVAGDRVQSHDLDLCAPHSNRIIYVHDPPNREMRLHPKLGEALSQAEVFLVSGFNSVQGKELLSERLSQLRAHMGRLPATALTFYEDAGFHVPELRQVVHEGLLDLVTVLSMNEDEMQEYLGRPVDLLDAAELVRALSELRAIVPARTLVVHTKYWSMALGEAARGYRGALQGGVTMASSRYTFGDAFDADDYHAVQRFPVHPQGAAVVEAVEQTLGESVSGVPAFVLTAATPTTIGLGDAFVGGFLAASQGAQPRP
ncbi:ADP-dependent glucokinase/phosphofructokinase [Phytoactinopolyspora endophytica]|uniref:ADP-dependent glucokinase/phosphofructokinase n=1 Tax=Phytoactinopolyspora endophytica TaxID=1642495 RepID=UPI00101CAADA|nr:ADP-dependent glucokinase/phosphofructokinase [Phytoactinopolyspora endophytica]